MTNTPAPPRAPTSRRGARLLTAVLIALAPATVRAEAPARASSLGWVRLAGAESCVGPRALALAVERRLGHEVFVSPGRAAIAIEGHVERTAAPEGFLAVLTVSDETGAALGTRELRSAEPSCAAMDDKLALVIAVMIDPEAAFAPRAPAPPKPLPALPAPPPRAPQLVYVPVPIAPPPPPVPWRASVQAGVITVLGLLPRLGGGAMIRARIEPPRFWAFELGGLLLFPNDARQGVLGATFQLAVASLAACPLEARAFGSELSLCAGAELGAIGTSGFGFDLPKTKEQVAFDVTLEGRVRRRLVGPLVAAAGLGLHVPVVRDRFYYLDAAGAEREVFRMSAVAGAADLSIGAELP